jgi:HEPN domain-containing protein
MPPEDAVDEVRGWIRKAESDLRNIALVLPADDCPYDTVCFHAQQAAEKYLKAALTFLGIPFPKVHDLDELLDLLPAEADVPVARDALTELSQLAVAPRYPGWDADIDRELAERSHATAQSVKREVLALLRTRGFTPDASR